MKKIKSILLSMLLVLSIFVSGCSSSDTGSNSNNNSEYEENNNTNQNNSTSQNNTSNQNNQTNANNNTTNNSPTSLADVPTYSGSPYVVINDNVPAFTSEDYTKDSFETYSELDALGRCGVVYANVGVDIMPTEERGSISHVKPTGWQQEKYDGEYLYNRCHLIGHQLAGEDANELNLITGNVFLGDILPDFYRKCKNFFPKIHNYFPTAVNLERG